MSAAAIEPLGEFPAPLLLPEDDLALDPRHPTQSLRSWIQAEYRNKVTPERKTLYLAVPPGYETDVDFAKKWAQPRPKSKLSGIEQPKAQDILEYLQAFYHGLPVKLFPQEELRFTSEFGDIDMPETDEKRQTIGLHFKESYMSKGIRTRPKPKGDYSHQLNLSDLLIATMWALPEDAYALVMLVEHDLYEDEEDEFVCGRAYGGSRVAVITTARYNPVLDGKQSVEREHAWPASHCTAYLDTMLEDGEQATRKRKRSAADNEVDGAKGDTAIQAAVSAHHALPSLEKSTSAALLSGLWLGRVCRTASHELGHCFGIGHCVYYACSMQGSASITEDARQPPYLCPVDLAKILHATGADVTERYQALLQYCEKHKDVHLFAAYGAWIRSRLRKLEIGV
ncbi:hypothetical protein EG329_000929 [Mollisiaceae sp. DMI_Dod_QoI]|nr:hypothetical protein EG329_000929 [Helotiales sp. DMI_Dod_QoI]